MKFDLQLRDCLRRSEPQSCRTVTLQFVTTFGCIESESYSALSATPNDVSPYAVYLLQRLRAGTLSAADSAAVKAALLTRVPALMDVLAYAQVDVLACVRTPLHALAFSVAAVDGDYEEEEVVVAGAHTHTVVAVDASARLAHAQPAPAAAAQRFEHGSAAVRVKLVVEAVQAVVRGQFGADVVELVTTPVLAAQTALILPFVLRAVPDLVAIEQLAPALLSVPPAAHLVVVAGLLYDVVCNTPNERSLEIVVDACVARLGADAQRRAASAASQLRHARGGAGPSATDVVLAQFLLRLCCLSARSAQTVVARLAAAVADEAVDVRRCHVPAYVALRAKSELLQTLIVASDSWLRPFVRQYHDVLDMGTSWRLSAQNGDVAIGGALSSSAALRLGGASRRSARSQGGSVLLLGESVPDWPRFALQEGEAEPAAALDPLATKNALLSTRQLLLARLHDAQGGSLAQLASLVRAFALLYGALGARAVADEAGKLVDVVVERLSRADAKGAAADELKQVAVCFVLVCEGLTRLCSREQLVRCARASLYSDTSSFSLLVTAHLAASSESGIASVVRSKLDAPTLVFNAESFKVISALLVAVLDEQQALQQCLSLPARSTNDADLACVYYFLTSGSFERHADDASVDLAGWMWRLLESADEHVAAHDAMHPLLPAVIDEFVLYSIGRRNALRSGPFAATRVRQVLSEWRAGSVPTARCCLVVYYVLRFNDESRVAHESRVQKRLTTSSTYAHYDDATLSLLPLRAIFRAATHGALGMCRFVRELLAAIHPPVVGLAARLVVQSMSLASQLDGSDGDFFLTAAAPPDAATALDGQLSLEAIVALASATVDLRARALSSCLATVRRCVVQLHKRRGLAAVLSLSTERSTALSAALRVLVDSIWPAAYNALPSRAAAELVAAAAAPSRGFDRSLAGIAWDSDDALRSDVFGGTAMSADGAEDDDAEEVQFDADLCKDMCVADPLAVVCGADRAMLACEPLFGLLVVAFELFLVTSRKHYADSLSMFALVASNTPQVAPVVNGEAAPTPAVPQTTADHYNRLRDALISTQESACVGVLAELATSRWLKRLFGAVDAPLDAALLDGMSHTVCALLHRLYCTHPPLLSMSLLHLADPELVAGDVADAVLDRGDPAAADDACAAVERRESELDEMLSVLCQRVPSLHASVSTIHSVFAREKSPASKLVLCVRLLAHLALLPLYRVPQTLEVCTAVLNRMMHGRGQSDVQFLKQAVLCLPALCVAFPTLIADALAILVDLCPLQLRAKSVAIAQARRSQPAEAAAMPSLLPSAAEVLLFGDAAASQSASRKRARVGDGSAALLDAEARARHLLAHAPRLPLRRAVQCNSVSERMQALLAHRCVVAFEAIVAQTPSESQR